MPIPANVENLLKQCDSGIAALKLFNANTIAVETTSSGAIAFFVPDANNMKIVLNVSQPPAVVAAYFCHEMNHAKMFINATTADPKKETQESYVGKMVAEEAAGTNIGFRTFYELESKGLTTGITPPDRYSMYKGAVDYGRKLKTDNEPGATPEQIAQAGFERGARMVQLLINDRYLGPNKIESYAEYYSRDWAQQNRKKP